jgi:uncharacterized membrane protein YjdF
VGAGGSTRIHHYCRNHTVRLRPEYYETVRLTKKGEVMESQSTTTASNRERRNERAIVWTYGISITLVLILGVVSLWTSQVFLSNAILGCAGLVILYKYRKHILFAWEGAVLGAAGIVMNTAGAIGAYELSYHGVGWDKLLHVVAMAGITIVAYAYLKKRHHQFSTAEMVLLALCIVEGIGAINEILEFIGSRYFSIGQGLFGMSNGVSALKSDFDNFDTQWDMIANTVGALLAFSYLGIKRLWVRKSRQ